MVWYDVTVLTMPLFMDIHRNVEASAADVAQAHKKDLETQGDYDVDFKEYWVDESEGTVFCLFEASDKADGEKVHREAHGLVAEEIHEVVRGR